MYDRFAGGASARCARSSSVRSRGNAASAERVWLAGSTASAGAMAAFPVDEAAERSRASCGWRSGTPRLALARRAAALPRGGRASRARPPQPSTSTRWPPTRASGAAASPARCWPRPSARPGAARCPASPRHRPDQRRRAALYAAEGFDEVAYRPRPGLPGFVRSSSRSTSALAPSTARSASTTRSTSALGQLGKKGRASERRATSSHTGNSPSRWPKRSR